MTVLRRLTLPVALALAAMATMSAPAFATTITSGGSPYSGPIEADESGAHDFDNGSFSVICPSTDFSGTIQSDGTGQITSWTFDASYCDAEGYQHSVSVEGLPYDFEVEHTSGGDGSVTITSPVTLAFEGNLLDCSVTAAAGTITADILGGTDWYFNGQNLARQSGSLSCWHGITWFGGYYVNTPADLQVGP